MRMEYTDSNFDGVPGDTIADYLVSVEAAFSIVDRGRVIYEEPCFPVVELAHSLVRWIARDDRVGFEFETASAEGLG
jgi:hypothetical protein